MNYEDWKIEMMGEILAKFKALGAIRAELIWIECGDGDRITRAYKNLKSKADTLKSHIDKLLKMLELSFEETAFAAFRDECELELTESQELHESEIEYKNRPHGLTYNTKALMNKTKYKIPVDIQVALSFGWKFNFPYTTKMDNMHKVLAQLDQCISESIPEGAQFEAFSETARILNKRNKIEHDSNKKWLKFIGHRTEAFFKEHDDCFPTRSDKGAHTVVIYNEQYDEEVKKMLNDSTTYAKMDENVNPLRELIENELELINVLKKNKKTEALIPGIQPNCLHLAKFYGLPKVHKEGFKLRPIVSMLGAPGHALSKTFNKILDKIFPRTIEHIKDSFSMKEFIDSVKLEMGEIITSLDAISMYTNIPRDRLMTIIMNEADRFGQIFGINHVLLRRMLIFLIGESVYFTAGDEVYKQIRGIPMGSPISTTLARIIMDAVVMHAYGGINDIKFIKIFVDDTLVCFQNGRQNDILNIFNNFDPRLQFTLEEENEDKAINFLNLTIKRVITKKRGTILSTNWYRKHFASGRLLNFYSSHKRTTVIATAETFLTTVIKLSDPRNFIKNKPTVISTLRDNSFPEEVIQALMNGFYTLMKPTCSKNIVREPFNFYGENEEAEEIETKPTGDGIYRIFPHAIGKSREIKKTLLNLKQKEIVYADSIKNTKINHIKTRKTALPIEKKSNLILISNCVCKTKYKIKKTRFNQTGEMLWNKMKTTLAQCREQNHAFRRVKYHNGLHYQSQTGYLFTYLKYLYRNKTIDDYGLPNYHLAKLMHENKHKT